MVRAWFVIFVGHANSCVQLSIKLQAGGPVLLFNGTFLQGAIGDSEFTADPNRILFKLELLFT